MLTQPSTGLHQPQGVFSSSSSHTRCCASRENIDASSEENQGRDQRRLLLWPGTRREGLTNTRGCTGAGGMPDSPTAGNEHELACAAVHPERRCPSLEVVKELLKSHLKEECGSPAPRAAHPSESIALRARHWCGDCAALTPHSTDHRLGENNLPAADNQAALLLAAATPEWKGGQLPRALPFFSCAVFTRRANVNCQTQLQTQNGSYLNSHFSSRLKTSDFSQVAQQKELSLSGSYSSLPIMP